MKILLIGGNGYIGSEIYKYLKSFDYDVSSVDACWHNKNLGYNFVIDYKTLTKEYVSNFDIVILTAAHSSVPMCNGNFLSSFNNNTVNFANLLEKIKNQKIIYASTSSVYGYVGHNLATEDFNDYRPNNNYDTTKILSDQIAQRSGKKYYGLRFGTVNGCSQILRTDIMINAMTTTCIQESKIKLFSSDICRPILGMKDLVRAVKAILDNDANPGLYNLASFNSTVEKIGSDVANHFNCKIEIQNEKTDLKNQDLPYSFSIDTSKFEKAFNFKFKETVSSICDDLASNFNSSILSPRKQYFKYL